MRHRLHHLDRRPKDWRGFFAAADQDQVHAEGVALVARLGADHDVVYLTGRPSHLRGDTEAWLGRHGLDGHELIMRSVGDRRPAARLKVELLRARAPAAEVALVVDDDAVVVAAMREAGYPVLHARWEIRGPGPEAALVEAQETQGRT
ncbi:MAG TPA: hypothetical protein VGO60_00715 [Iamia sp.]|nr:hypothetical protein [Iamia sp.]